MEKKKLLFVCTVNLNRSPTAEALFKGSKKYQAKSVGINQLAKTVISGQAIRWADIVFCMENIHKEYILENFPEVNSKEIIVLNIPDIYIKDDPELVNLLKKKLKSFI